MILVNLPDGSQASFPDGTPPDVMKAAIQKRFPPQGAQGLQQRLAGQQPSSNIEDQTPQQRPDAMNSTIATVNGLVNGIPILGPLAQNTTDMIGGGISQLTGGNYDAYVRRQQRIRQEAARAAPIASMAGNIGGALASFGGLGSIPAGAEALGITGTKTLPRLVNSVLSTQAIGTADNMARGQKPMDATINAVAPSLAGGLGGPLIGGAVGKLGGKIASTLTNSAQNRLTKAATQGAPDAAALKTVGSQLFNKAFGGNIPAVTDTAMMRFVGDVRQAMAGYRPNVHTSQQAVGILQHMMELADAANTPGTVVDLKDLHILRQTAGGVLASNSADQSSKAIARKIVDSLDNFIGTLKPADILGGADPSQAAGAMKKAISTWSTASKVGIIENAIEHADTYKSGVENGLKLSFLNVMKQPEFKAPNYFSPMEKTAVRAVAKGTTGQNIAELFGKLGFAFSGGAAHNIGGGAVGTFGLSGALSPVLGPLALPVAFGTTTAAGIAGRRVAEKLATQGANRAAKIVATPNIPVARQVRNLLGPARKPIEILIRGGAMGLSR